MNEIYGRIAQYLANALAFSGLWSIAGIYNG
jgi:hypothetical protein